jgi:hypothetical protein
MTLIITLKIGVAMHHATRRCGNVASNVAPARLVRVILHREESLIDVSFLPI